MKAQILKISGHKNEKDFYKEFPTMEKFMAKHGAAFKKAQGGMSVDTNKNGVPDYLELNPPNSYTGAGNNLNYFGSGIKNQPMFGPQTNPTPAARFPKPIVSANSNDVDFGGLTNATKGDTEFMNEGMAAAGDTPGDTGGVSSGGLGTGDYVQAGVQLAGAALTAKENYGSERKELKNSRAWADVSGIVKKAALMKDVDAPNVIADNFRRKRKALMPTITGEELFPVNGVGTNSLGQAKGGGKISKAQNGKLNYFNSSEFQENAPSWASLANAASSINANMNGGPDAGTELGGTVGQTAGTLAGTAIAGPIGGMVLGAVGKFAGGAIGGALDKNDDKIKEANKRMNANMAEISGIQELRNNYSAYARSGGNLRSNQVGDISALSGGHLEPMSYNPYSDGNGITSMIKGQTHEESNGRHTGVLLNYNKAEDGASMNADVEAETGEPVTEIGNSAVIFGDQVINDITVGGDPMFKGLYGKTFKKAMAGIAEQNQKLNKQQAKNTKALNDLDVKTPIDKLALNSFTVNAKAIDTKYALNDAIMKKAAAHQEIVNQEAERLGINSGAFSRGKLAPADNESAYSKNGGIIKAQSGTKGKAKFKGNVDPNKKYGHVAATPGALDYTEIGSGNDDIFSSPEAYTKYKEETNKAYADPEMAKQLVDYFKNYEGEDWQDVRAAINKGRTFDEQRAIAQKLATDGLPGRFHINTAGFKTPAPIIPTPPVDDKKKIYDVAPYKNDWFGTIAGQILPWMRKQPGEGLRGDQLAGEMFALSNNQEEPVDARFYHPQLRTPYDISYQDQLNENQADFNQLVDASGNNPQALSALAAQKYGANSRVLAEQFRANQAMKENIYSGNIQTLNDAQQRNLAIADQQYVRQAQAKSATKAVKQEAISSISSKIGQNRLENRTLQTYANMFPDYSFDKNYRIRHTGAPVDWQIDQGIYNKKGTATEVPIYGENNEITGYRSITSKEARHGGIVKAFKSL